MESRLPVRRTDARIRRGALDEVKAIQTLLADVYKDTGDGRTLLRELVQNADDAEAARLVFGVLHLRMAVGEEQPAAGTSASGSERWTLSSQGP